MEKVNKRASKRQELSRRWIPAIEEIRKLLEYPDSVLKQLYM
ncbi:MAG: hypothetical protein ACTHKF_03545 [Candidatus Nitrosocosmicus sp.]